MHGETARSIAEIWELTLEPRFVPYTSRYPMSFAISETFCRP